MFSKMRMFAGFILMIIILAGLPTIIVGKALDLAEGGFSVKEKTYTVTSFAFKKEKEYAFLFPYEEEYIFLHLDDGSTQIIHPQELNVGKGKYNRLFIQQEIYNGSKSVRDTHYKLVLSDSDYQKFSSQYAFTFNRTLP
jgi:hypothetical protein